MLKGITVALFVALATGCNPKKEETIYLHEPKKGLTNSNVINQPLFKELKKEYIEEKSASVKKERSPLKTIDEQVKN